MIILTERKIKKQRNSDKSLKRNAINSNGKNLNQNSWIVFRYLYTIDPSAKYKAFTMILQFG